MWNYDYILHSFFRLICKSLVFETKSEKTYTFPLSFSPYYENKDKKKLFKCFYFEGKAIVKDVSSISPEYGKMLLSDYALGNLRNKNMLW